MSLMPETLTEPPKLSKEDIDMIVSAAEGRVVVADGVDYLDGYVLPPANDEPWGGERSLKGRFTTVFWNGDRLVGIEQTEKEFPITITNRTIRASNMAMIAQGKEPLYIKWEEVDYSSGVYERPSVFERVGGWKGKLLSTLWLN